MNEEEYLPSMEELIYDADYSELEEKINKNSYFHFNAHKMLRTLFSGAPFTTYAFKYTCGDEEDEWIYIKRRCGNSQVSDFFSVSLRVKTKDGIFLREWFFKEIGFLGDNEDRIYGPYSLLEGLIEHLV